MDPRQIRKRCPSSRFQAIAVLPDYRLDFTLRSTQRRCGVANVLPSQFDSVIGALYRINSTRDWEVLDAAEGFKKGRKRGNRYTRSVTMVKIIKPTGREVSAFIYIGLLEKSPPPPSKAYLSQMINGAIYWNFPLNYIESLIKIKQSIG